MVESEDEGEEAEGEAEEDAGPSKKVSSPPPTKKAKRDKEEEVDDGEGFTPSFRSFSFLPASFCRDSTLLSHRRHAVLSSTCLPSFFSSTATPASNLPLLLTELAKDPEAVKVREWRHRLQKAFLSKNIPKEEVHNPLPSPPLLSSCPLSHRLPFFLRYRTCPASTPCSAQSSRTRRCPCPISSSPRSAR